MSNLLSQIQSLTQEQALEAAITFSNIITGGIEDKDASSVVKEIEKKPFEHLEEIEELSRLILINAAEKDEYLTIVQEVVNNAGQKQFILGGTEIVALAALAVAALKIIINPKSEETVEIKDSKGRKKKIHKKYDGDPGFLSSIFKSLFK